MEQGMFAAKLRELEEQYGRLENRLRLCQRGDRTKIHQEMLRAADEYRETESSLQENAEESRSPAVAALAGVQLEYLQKIREILEQKLPEYLGAGSQLEGRTEAAALYGEYAIDFAVQSIRYALLAALEAMDLQMSLEEQEKATGYRRDAFDSQLIREA